MDTRLKLNECIALLSKVNKRIGWTLANIPVQLRPVAHLHDLSDDEIYKYVVLRRTLVHGRSKREPLTHDESDWAVRIASIKLAG